MNLSRKSVLFLSRDYGSVQATLPVISVLQSTPGVAVSIVSLAVSQPLLAARGIPFTPLDEGAFDRAPAATIAAILENFRPDLVVSGSSPAKAASPETPEQYVILEARRLGMATLSILDAWLLYRERFTTDTSGDHVSLDLIPDRLCVLDKRCHADLLRLGVPPDRMVITHNPWLDDVAKAALSPPAPSNLLCGEGLTVLFVSQPLAEMARVRKWPFTQIDLFNHLIRALPQAAPDKQHRVLVWEHPSEQAGRWESLAPPGRNDVEIVLTTERGAPILAHVDMIVSSHSTVAYEALYFGTPCISLRPNGQHLAPLVTDEIGISRLFHDMDDFRDFLTASNLNSYRIELMARKQELEQAGIFFNDGRATQKVLAEIYNLLHN